MLETTSAGSSGSAPGERGGFVRHRPWWPLASAALVALVAIGLWWRTTGGRSGELPDWTPRQLTSDPGWEAEPALSPDGSLVAYSSNRAGSADIWVIDARGGTSLRLTDDPADDRSRARPSTTRAIM